MRLYSLQRHCPLSLFPKCRCLGLLNIYMHWMGVFLTLHNLLFWSQSLLSSCISKAQMLFILLPYTVNDSVVFHFMICIHCSVKKHENARDDSGSSCLLPAVGRKPFTLHLVYQYSWLRMHLRILSACIGLISCQRHVILSLSLTAFRAIKSRVLWFTKQL